MIYVINKLKSSQKKYTIDTLFTIDQFTIARFDCKYVIRNSSVVVYSEVFQILKSCTNILTEYSMGKQKVHSYHTVGVHFLLPHTVKVGPPT